MHLGGLTLTITSAIESTRVCILALLEVWQRGRSSKDRLGLRSEPCELKIAQVIVGIICLVDRFFRESLDVVYGDEGLRTDLCDADSFGLGELVNLRSCRISPAPHSRLDS